MSSWKTYATLVSKWSCGSCSICLICLFPFHWQVNMVIGILVFNKLVSRDGILDKKLKHRAGYDSASLLVPYFSSKHSVFLTSCKNTNMFRIHFTHVWRRRPRFSCCIKRHKHKGGQISLGKRRSFVFLWQNQSKTKFIKVPTHRRRLLLLISRGEDLKSG